MKKKDNFNTYLSLRKEYEFFIYEDFKIVKNSDHFHITFFFNFSDKYFFKPTLKIPFKHFYKDVKISDIENIIFHIGLIELISYWKAACSPEIIVKCGFLNDEQIAWWKKLYFHGLGEFFFLNSIKTNLNDFVKIIIDSDKKFEKQKYINSNVNIIPIGGGKDSIVTLELFSEQQKQNKCFIVNHREASLRVIQTAGYSMDDVIEFHRTIDNELLKLNEKGFLNGHTPFSALLAFNSLLASVLSGIKNIVLSNESSANEPTVEGANHQYSKSFEFESDFRKYVKSFITEDINYYSLLRPLTELQIAKLFSMFPKYFEVFKSCNVGSKTDEWCGKCPKCLFTYIILSPFVESQKLQEFFGKDLFKDDHLLNYFNELTGIADEKPFECIGTIYEINISLCKIIENNRNEKLPFLLNYYRNSESYNKFSTINFENFLNNFEQEHFLSSELFDVLYKKLNEEKSAKANWK